jgi:hypothetical protein
MWGKILAYEYVLFEFAIPNVIPDFYRYQKSLKPEFKIRFSILNNQINVCVLLGN